MNNKFLKEFICSTDKFREEKTYWINKLESNYKSNHFPYDFSESEDNIYKKNTYNFKLCDELASKLIKVSNNSNKNIYIFLLTSIVTILHKYTGDKELFLVAPIQKQLVEDELINEFLILANQISEETTFKELLLQVKDELTESERNKNYPIDVMLNNLGFSSGVNNSSLYPTVIMLKNIHNKGYAECLSPNILMSFNRTNNEIEGSVEFNLKLYKENTIKNIVKSINVLLDVVIDKIDIKICEISLISEEERKILFNFNNNENLCMDRTICNLFEENVCQYPNKTAVKCGNEKLTYDELNKRTNKLARLLREKGVNRDKLVCILCERSIDMLVAILATFKAGGAYIPLDVKYPIDRIKTIISDSGAEVLLTSSYIHFNIEDLYMEIGLNTNVNCIISMNELKEINKYDKLFRTMKLSKIISKENDLVINEDVLVYKDEYVEYEQYRSKIKKLEGFIKRLKLKSDSTISLLIDNPIEKIITISALRNVDQKYYIIENTESIKDIINVLKDKKSQAIFTESKFASILDDVLWKIDNIEIGVIINEINYENSRKELEFKTVWNYIAEKSTNQINDYGWMNSYDGERFSEGEMRQYIDNFKTKLSNHLNYNSKVLEIGCGHGLMLFELVGLVGEYTATDLSEVIIEKNKQRAKEKNINNVKFKALAASQIEQVGDKDFDVITCTSVVHYFPSTLYLEYVIKNSIDLLKDEGFIYLDDLMDLRKKEEFRRSILDYKSVNPNARSKTNLEADLFIDPEFLSSLQYKYREIEAIEISNKIGDIQNELTKYRYDVLIKVNKKCNHESQNIRPNKVIFTLKDIDLSMENLTASLDSYENLNFSKDYKIKSSVDLCKINTYSEENIDLINDLNDLSYIIYTSGSTGKPKGAMVEHIGMMNHMMCKIKDLNLTSESIIVQNASQCFDISVWQFLCALAVGGCTTIYTNDVVADIDKFIKSLIDDKVNVLEVVPSFLSVLLDRLEENKKQLHTLEYLVVTGEAMNKKLAERWFGNYPNIKMVNAYGPTEASDDITHYTMDKAPTEEKVSIGRPLYNFNIYIVDENMNLCPIGVKGELVVSGIGVGRGYLNDKEKTEKAFMKDPFVVDEDRRLYKTGDIARWMEDGNIEFFNRKDYQVKIRGLRIELGEIESNLLKIEAIKEAIVMDKEEVDGSKYLCAYIVSNEEIDIENLKKELNKKLPAYMIPTYFIKLDKIPTNANGKIDKKALIKIVPKLEEKEQYVPTNEIERKLVEIWKEVLKVDFIGVNDSFFDLGGHSLKAIELTLKIQKDMNIKIGLQDILNNTTIKKMIDYIDNIKRECKYIPIKKIEEKDYYQCSSAQKRIFTVQQFDVESTSYNIPFSIEVHGILDNVKLENIFNKLLKRHEALRTSFELIDGEVMQKVNKICSLNINYYDEMINNIEELIKPFDLSKAPLFRVNIIKKSKDCYIMMFDIHHIISDAATMKILISEFLQLYHGDELEYLNVQYKDFAAYQNELLKSESIKKQEDYWLKTFSDGVPVPNFKTDYPRSEIKNFYCDRINIILHSQLTEKIKDRAKETNSTIFMFFLAAYNILISKYTGEEDLVVGTLIEGRNHPDLDKVVGMFVNTLVLRNKPHGNKTFKQFLDEVKENSLEAFQNQDYQFEDLVKKLNINREYNRKPLFDTLFAYVNEETEKFEIDGLQIFPYEVEERRGKFDLQLTVFESSKDITISLEYLIELFNQETIKKIGDRMINILDQIVNDINIKISDIEIQQDFLIADSYISKDDGDFNF